MCKVITETQINHVEIQGDKMASSETKQLSVQGFRLFSFIHQIQVRNFLIFFYFLEASRGRGKKVEREPLAGFKPTADSS